MAAIDPTTIRLSDSFLLSDFMGCDSVYRLGIPNRITDADDFKIDEGRYLAENLEEVLDRIGPMSISYGYISPELSRRVVHYQDPNKPSYHRWDAGAAADVIPHLWYEDNKAPVYFAYEILQWLPISRIITYAESEVVCVATKKSEPRDKPRKAFYENRFLGERVPHHVKHSQGEKALYNSIDSIELPCDWRGRGYPSYHGGGRKQYEHHRIGRYVLLSDFLYHPYKVHAGESNAPWVNGSITGGFFDDVLADAARVLDAIVENFYSRMSVVSGFNRSINVKDNWQRRFQFEIVPPKPIDANDVAHFVTGKFDDVKIRIRKMRRGEDRIVLVGRDHG